MLMRVCGIIVLIYQFCNVFLSIELSGARMMILKRYFCAVRISFMYIHSMRIICNVPCHVC